MKNEKEESLGKAELYKQEWRTGESKERERNQIQRTKRVNCTANVWLSIALYFCIALCACNITKSFLSDPALSMNPWPIR